MEESSVKKIDKGTPLLTVTDTAANQIRQLQQNFGGGPETQSIRIRVKKNCCSSMAYEMKFEGRGPGDHVIKIKDDICIVIDSESAPVLEGALIDFEDGFHIRNPNKRKGCGCGRSESSEN